MNRTTPQMRSIAERLIQYETPKKDASGTADAATLAVTERLRPHLATLMGNGGYRALLARALKLASAEVSWLRTVQVNADGVIEGFEPLRARLIKPAEFHEGRVVLLAKLLGLLVAFIGPGLTSRLVGEIWPRIEFADRDFGKEQ